jgi:signal transduction histidine kinase/CheY-like chemotaxis protein
MPDIRHFHGDGTDLVRHTWAEFIEKTLRPTVVVVLAAYWIWQIWYGGNTQRPEPSQTVITTLFALALTAITWQILAERAHLAVLLWSVGLSVGAMLSGTLLQTLQPFVIVPVAGLVTALLLGHLAGVAVAIGSLSFPILGAPLLPQFPEGWLIAIVGWSATAVAVGGVLRRGMEHTVDWYLVSYQQAIDNMREARERRAEMVKLVQELDKAYYRLARLNASLIQAWRRATEAENRRAELVTTISHEMRTPLNLILGFSELILASPESYDDVPLPAIYRSDLHAIYRSSTYLLQLIDDVLDLAKADVGKLTIVREETNLDGILTECVQMLEGFGKAKGIELRCHVDSHLPAIVVDRLRIRQVVLNLLTNAVRFTDSGYIELSAVRDGANILLTIKDTGQGISPDRQQTIFEEFGSAPTGDEAWHSGSGLGVPISKRLVELHGGTMWLESAPGRGTTFYFTLPLQNRLPDQAPPREDRATAWRLASRPLLLAATADQTLVQWLRRKTGAEVVAVDDAAKAQAQVSEARPDLVLVDAEDETADRDWDVPLLQMRLPDRVRRARPLGVQAILTKPLTKQVLLRALEMHAPHARRILVIDDDARFVDLVTRMLSGQEADYRVMAAYTADDALAILAAEHVDMLFVDQRLSETTGAELCQRIRMMPKHRDTPALLVSAYDLDAIIDHPPTQLKLILPQGSQGGQAVDLVDAILRQLSTGQTSSAVAPALAEG